MPIDGWFTIFDLNRNYDLIVGKNWMSSNPHRIDHSINTLHMLREGWETLSDTVKLLTPSISIVSLVSQHGGIRETQNYCAAGAESAGLNTISVSSVWASINQIFIANVWLSPESVRSDTVIKRSNIPDLEFDILNREFNRWHANIQTKYVNLFCPPTGVLPPSGNNFRIPTDPLAKAPYWQPYRQFSAEREAYEEQICKPVANE
jgi:hypothetical protein